ncbi:carbamoyltransferase HypF [Blastopirellula marina]|uniref:Carbamoyltransferase n=1 Tax=Blastopirellula marina TaxID=124 RepID=A0A2S8GHK4_9BACT|nr:carbamoyltransferase HypF [Blastopirellula marina]
MRRPLAEQGSNAVLSVSSQREKRELAAPVATKIVLQGRVQGIGARPAIYRLATCLDLAGEVRNTVRGVEIVVEGLPLQVEQFLHQLRSALPIAAEVMQEACCDVPVSNLRQFSIIKDADDDAIVTSAPVDVAVCADCLAEVWRPGTRRYRYALNSCASCGPRYSIIRRMPFERDQTAMADFPLCDDCLVEYRNVDDRRFHAQTISCPQCGPRLWGVTADGKMQQDQEAAFELAALSLLRGEVVALKGVGGYQLLVDATNRQAVAQLRQRKGRPSKPLAVMAPAKADAHRIAHIDAVERNALTSSANPIVLLKAKRGSEIVDAVYPGLDTIGVLLPTTPLHALLLERVGRPLVCTSGNREGAPLAFDVAAAETELADICDLWLHHNRPIVRPIDDSVVRVIGGKVVALRLARGLAPLRLELKSSASGLALGGEMKSAAAFCHHGSAVLGPHVGDVSNLATQQRYRWHLADWETLYRFSPHGVACDQHPGYFTSRMAAEVRSNVQPLQHHHAHAAAAMLQHAFLDQEVLAVVWDGTGYGSDQSIWGGEFLQVADKQFQRFAHLRSFVLPGGEAAIREPWRIAAALLEQVGCGELLARIPTEDRKPAPVAMIRQIAGNRTFSPVTTSAGRLLDGLATLILQRTHSEYEGELPMRLEACADRDERDSYELAIEEGQPLQLDWRPLVRRLIADIRADVTPPRMAMRVQRGLAAAIVDVCRRRPELPVLLAGGVFQNRLLGELVAEMAADEALSVYLPGIIPPGDGGLAAGQLALAFGE